MKKLLLGVAAAFLVSGGFVVWANVRQGQETPKPGKQHEYLKQFEGTWEVRAKFMGKPGEPMVESKGTETAAVGQGGFWLTFDYKGEMFGTPFAGHGVMGYDLRRQKFVGVWIDSMESGLFLSEGTSDESGKVFTMTAEGYCSIEGKSIPIKMKQISTIKDKDTRTLTMSMPGPDGKEMITGIIEYKRKK